MKKRVLLAGVLTAAMMAMTACNGMPGMGNTQPAATQARGGDSSEAAASDDKVYELKISTSQTEQALITRNYQKLADVLNEKSGGRLKVTSLAVTRTSWSRPSRAPMWLLTPMLPAWDSM